jgi:hypothetical protein
MHSADCEIEKSKLMNLFTESATSTTYKLNIKNPMVPNIGVTVSFSCWIVPMIADRRVAAAVWAVPPPTSTAQWEQIRDKRVGAGSLVHGDGAPLYKNHPSDVYNNKAMHSVRTLCMQQRRYRPWHMGHRTDRCQEPRAWMVSGSTRSAQSVVAMLATQWQLS